MNIELIPVIEIGYNNQGVTEPVNYPYWQNSEIWDNYHERCYEKAGFQTEFNPYLKGSSFYKISDISDINLTKLTIDHTQDFRDKKYGLEQTCTFFGGYVLRIEGEDNYFPQCCGELSDIIYWQKISNGQNSYYEGHPAPELKFEKENIIFDFSTNEFDEIFQPPPKQQILVVNRLDLLKAVEKAKLELQQFELRLQKINKIEDLNIDNIGGMLIWENLNYS